MLAAAMSRIPWWVWVSGTPFGLGAWTPIVPGRELGRRSWIGWGVLWSLMALAGWIGAIVNDGGTGAGFLLIGSWAGAIATTCSIRSSYLQQSGSAFTRGREAAMQRLKEREEAQRLAAEQPDVALELGVGRPDRPGAQDGGLVDVNNAPAEAIGGLPGVDDALARRIVEVREQVNGFSSLADLGAVLDLDGNAVERLREHTVFLPR
jgi:DNA uptake protein ComE-like DNA-binding protein